MTDTAASSRPVRHRADPWAGRELCLVRRHRRAGLGHQPRLRRHADLRDQRQAQPDFFVHSGDNIYADGPITATVALPDGGTWRNLTTEAKSKVAETLAEFRGNYQYNLLDSNLRRCYAEVPCWPTGTTTRRATTGIPDGTNFEAVASGDPRPLGRELKIATLLSAIKRRGVTTRSTPPSARGSSSSGSRRVRTSRPRPDCSSSATPPSTRPPR